MDNKKIEWIEGVLSNDENSTDQEMVEYFMSEGLKKREAVSWVTLRDEYSGGIYE